MPENSVVDNILICGNSKEVLKEFDDNSIDAVVCDPPYELGFMGKSWDKSGIANDIELWKEVLRVLKPGGHLLAFSGTRTYHRMASAIEDAGFEVRDMIEWVYGSGFPKSLNISKAMDGVLGKQASGFNTAEGKDNFDKQDKSFQSDYGYKYEPQSDNVKEWEGWGTNLKPSHEPICMARKPLSEKTVAENCLKWGTGGINIDESRVEGKLDGDPNRFSKTDGGWGVAEFHEAPVVRSEGRFPANLIHDNSEEVRECFPETKSGGFPKQNTNGSSIFGTNNIDKEERINMNDSGNASRFFKSILYYPKASKSERNRECDMLEKKCIKQDRRLEVLHTNPVTSRLATNPQGNHHPTVKPIALMEYLIKMITREGQTVLDPFMGSGSTGVAAKLTNRKFIGIELNKEYVDIAEARINYNNKNKNKNLKKLPKKVKQND